MSPAAGDDPCEGCKIKAWYDWEPEHELTEYSFFLAGWLEDFKSGPGEISWRDYGIYQVFKRAKAEYEKEKIDGYETNS